MKQLRQYIRKILLESPELQGELDEFIFNREHVPETVGGGTQHREYAKEKIKRLKDDPNYFEDPNHPWPTDKEIDQGINLRRDVKKFWNEHADHNFWNNEIAALHDLGYYGGISNTFYAGAEFEPEKDLPFASFVKKYPIGKRQKDEMSTYGCYDDPQEIAIKMNDDELSLCVKLKGIVTYASATDSFTESRSEATPTDFKRHASSGMPKRPAVSHSFQSGFVLFDKEDLEDRGSIGELVIDNWTWDTVYVMASVFPHHFIRDLGKLCKQNGINLVQV
ncbi:TPA: hypothetical protein HA278_00725 [Candidatus Woesearchaeota archaeon]|nr:hypothetical protein [Candidatus Woesearchaeota archaeon]